MVQLSILISERVLSNIAVYCSVITLDPTLLATELGVSYLFNSQSLSEEYVYETGNMPCLGRLWRSQCSRVQFGCSHLQPPQVLMIKSVCEVYPVRRM
jgi:hypothetical protein